MNSIKRDAVGNKAAVGSLYDARRDAFLAVSIWGNNASEDAVVSTEMNQEQSSLGKTDGFKGKFEKLGLTDDLAASFLAGVVEVQGSARYLKQRKTLLPA